MFHLPLLLISLVLFFVWSLFLFFGKSTRREQIVLSVAGLVVTPALLMAAATDYRVTASTINGFVGIEDLIFAFSLTGVAAVAYEVLVGRRLKPLRKKYLTGRHPIHWLAALVFVFGGWGLISGLSLLLFPINSIYALIVGGLMVETYIIADRHDLLLDAVFSGLFMAFLTFGLEQLFFVHLFPTDAGVIWQVDRLSGFLPGGLPLEEFVWFLIVGMAIGPVYEFIRHYRVN